MKVPLCIPDLSGNEEQYVTDAVRSTWVSSQGKYVDRFEQEFAAICGAKHALSVTNGTVALELALRGLGVGPGDEVVVPDLAYVAVANAVTYVGATAVTCDVDRHSWCISPTAFRNAITPRTKAVVAVHNYGMPADMVAICASADMHGVHVVEDAAEAHFAVHKGRPVGSWGKVATFSFYGNKIVTCGEGGAVVTSDVSLARRMRFLRGQGMDPAERYWHPDVGYNYRLTNVACAILCAQLERRDDILERRRTVYGQYRARLQGEIPLQPEGAAPWLFPIIPPVSRGRLVASLEESGVESRPFFFPISSLPPYRQCAKGPTANKLSRRGAVLPTFPDMTEEQVRYVCEKVLAACA
jgi:perosamine synthetase